MKLYTVEQRKKLLDEELTRITDILVQSYDPEKILLFGSLAQDKVHEWSDIDLLIVKKTVQRPIERILEANRLIRPKVGIDLFIYTPDEIDILMREKSSFLTDIMQRGKVLYEKRD